MRLFVITSFLLFCTVTHSAIAQNFQPFKNKFKYQFSYTGIVINQIRSGLIHGIEVDSANLVDSDSIFYFNRLDYYSSSNFKDNFWGHSMVKKNGGEYLFLVTNGSQNDTLIVKTQETLGAQWTFELATVLYTIQYKSYKQEAVLTNQTDYVKTFIVENASGFKDSIKISENFGLVYSFPFSDNYSYKHTNFNLTYILNLKIGENKINYFEYFNYDLGDILEYTSDYRIVAGYPEKTGNNIYKVISKTISDDADTITYSFSVCHLGDRDDYHKNFYETTQTHCAIRVTAHSVTGNFPYLEPLTFVSISSRFVHAVGLFGINSMVFAPVRTFEYDRTFKYTKGLGLQQYSRSGGMDYDDQLYQNIRYIKQSNIDDDCNLSIILSAKSLHASSGNLLVAPNPFKESISLNASDLNPGKWNIRIVSALGVEVYTSEVRISSSNQQIDMSNLPTLTTGMYFLSVENDSQVYSQKIVKH